MLERTCVTRTLKIAHQLQRTRPDVVPAVEPLEGFASILEGTDPSMKFVLRDIFGARGGARATNAGSGRRFSGTLRFARLVVTAGARRFALSANDAAAIVEYAGLALPTISDYARQYGPVVLSLAEAVAELPLTAPRGLYNDAMVRTAVDSLGSPDATTALIVLAPPGPIPTDADPGRGAIGYHARARVPYAFVNVGAGPLGSADPTDRFALALSHAIAELAVDPDTELGHAEVCDPCGPSTQAPVRCFLDSAGGFLGGTAAFPPPFAYSHFVSAVAPPSFVGDAPAPLTACAYAPPVGHLATPPRAGR
jgi:hypothetical protein